MSTGRKVMGGIVALILLIIIAGVFLFWRYPIAIGMRIERRELANAGFQKTTLQGPTPLVVWQAGSGPPLILLHGAGDQAGAWSKVAPQLTGRYRVIIPDQPGHGESAPKEGPLSLGTVLAGLNSAVEQCSGGQPVILAGNSMGAWIAMLYAREHPGRVVRVVAVNGGALLGRTDVSLLPADREEARKVMALLRDPGSPPYPDFVLDDVVRSARSGPIGRMLATGREMNSYLLDGKLNEVRVPVDMVWGESDQLMSLDYARKMQEQLPVARLTTIPHCGHSPLRECPIAFTAALKNVLQQPPPEPNPAPVATSSEKKK